MKLVLKVSSRPPKTEEPFPQDASERSRFGRIILDTGWLLSSRVATSVMAFLQELLIAQTLRAELYGRLGIAMTFVVVVNRLTAFRMGELVIQFVNDALAAGRKAEAAAVIKWALIAEATMSALAFALTELLAPWGARLFLQSRENTALIMVFAVVILGNLVTETSVGILQVFGCFRRQSILSTVGKTITVAAVLVAFFVRPDLWGIIIALLIGNLASSTLLLIGAQRTVRDNLGHGWWKTPLSEMDQERRSAWKFALNTNLSGTLSLITKDADLLWLGLLRGSLEAGYFKLASQLVSTAFLPIQALGRSTYPTISQLATRQQWSDFRDLLKKLSYAASAYAIPLALLLGLLGAWLIPKVYGESFLPAYDALVWLLAGAVVSAVLFWGRSALLALGRADLPLKINLLIAALKLAGIYFIVRSFGYVGNAALLSTLYLIGLGLTLLVVRRETRLRERTAA